MTFPQVVRGVRWVFMAMIDQTDDSFDWTTTTWGDHHYTTPGDRTRNSKSGARARARASFFKIA